MATSPTYAAGIVIGTATVSATAETSVSTGAQSVAVFTGSSNGTRVERIDIAAVGTTTAACVVYLYVSDGTTHRLIKSVQLDAVAASATVAPPTRTLVFDSPILLPTGSGGGIYNTIRASSTAASALFQVTVYGMAL